ncbi:hypothetical protein [Trueperella sp. LYQ143]|uniref:hypothetical protein n=1 Tax=Trueperella sp. LYQ143 TaxID=3391059 RepID=UPI003982FFFE
MIEHAKEFIRSYVYWIGLLYGLAVIPGYLLFTLGLAPVNTPLWAMPIVALLLFYIDPPSRWRLPRRASLSSRLAGTGFASATLVAFDATFCNHYGSRHWGETLISLGVAWLIFAIAAELKSNHTQVSQPAEGTATTKSTKGTDAVRTFAAWVGIFFGIFAIPSAGLAAMGTLLMVFPLYGAFLTGFVLLAVDPPRRWPLPRRTTLWIKIIASGVAALLLCAESSIYRDTSADEICFGDWQENLLFCMSPWIVYTAAAIFLYFTHRRNHQSC